MEKRWERADGRWGTISFPPSQRMHADAQVWKMNKQLILYGVAIPKAAGSIRVFTSIRDLHVLKTSV